MQERHWKWSTYPYQKWPCVSWGLCKNLW